MANKWWWVPNKPGRGDRIQIGWVVPLNLLTTVVAKKSHVKKNNRLPRVTIDHSRVQITRSVWNKRGVWKERRKSMAKDEKIVRKK